MTKQLFRNTLCVIICAVLITCAFGETTGVYAISCCRDGFDKSAYTLTGNTPYDVAAIAKSQKGRTRSDFGYTEDWCDEFVADCLENAGLDASKVAHGGYVDDFEYEMKKRGAVDVANPQVGDLIFWGGAHVEIVTKVENGVAYSAGGNNGGAVGGQCNGERPAGWLTDSFGVEPHYVRPDYSNASGNDSQHAGNGSTVSAGTQSHVHDYTFDPSNEKCSCGERFTPATVEYTGTAKVKTSVYLKSAPYRDYSSKVVKVASGKKVTVKKSRTNVYGNTWYEVTYTVKGLFTSRNYTGYIHEDKLDLSGARAVIPATSVKVDLTWPTENASVRRAPQSIEGWITASNGNISRIDMYVDGVWYAGEGGINVTSYNLWGSTFDWNLPFGSLGCTAHELRFVIVDTNGGTHEFVRHFTTVW